MFVIFIYFIYYIYFPYKSVSAVTLGPKGLLDSASTSPAHQFRQILTYSCQPAPSSFFFLTRRIINLFIKSKGSNLAYLIDNSWDPMIARNKLLIMIPQFFLARIIPLFNNLDLMLFLSQYLF